MSHGDLHPESQVARSGRVGRRVTGFPKIFVSEMPKSFQLLFREKGWRFFQLPSALSGTDPFPLGVADPSSAQLFVFDRRRGRAHFNQ